MTLVGGQNLSSAVGFVQAPGLTVADILIQFQRLVLSQDTDGVDAGVNAVGQGEVDDAILAAEGDGRLGGFLRQDVEAAALATGQQHGNAAFFLKVHWSQLLMKCIGAGKNPLFARGSDRAPDLRLLTGKTREGYTSPMNNIPYFYHFRK